MTDWAGWGTSIGTLVLAGATFVSVRSANRSARIAERSLLAGQRPLLVVARREDTPQEIRITIDLLYGDLEDGQPTITRFVLLPTPLTHGAATPHTTGAPREGSQRSIAPPVTVLAPTTLVARTIPVLAFACLPWMRFSARSSARPPAP